ncbi:hypothetical protein JCM10003_1663 [Bacteroides pyogenes JCM 10003]|nr:hypothetical protein JCM10003_1663 [Bacteroides pyogenes JCM 10003]
MSLWCEAFVLSERSLCRYASKPLFCRNRGSAKKVMSRKPNPAPGSVYLQGILSTRL